MAERTRLNPEKAEKDKNEKRAVEATKKAVEESVFSKELNEKFKDLQAAIQAEENRLQELYGVGREVQKLALAIEAGRDRISAIEAERTEKEEASRSSLEKMKAEFELKKTELQAEHDTILKKLKMERTREGEEYQYNLTRMREREDNAWTDEKAVREAALQKKEAAATALLAEAESKAGYIQSLEEKTETIPSQIAAERAAAIASTTEALKREYDHQTALAEMEHNSSVLRLEDKVSYLEKQLAASAKAVEVLQGKLDKAYSEMRDLAAKTVESTGGLKILNNDKGNN
jgi:hypothetical protein